MIRDTNLTVVTEKGSASGSGSAAGDNGEGAADAGDAGSDELSPGDLEEPSSASSASTVPDENIDFTLVYAYHTFTATLDGQVTVTRGDSLVLLDDSNSYWWLVKNLETSAIGYIPAENIETPYERLARLNRHRNLKLALEDFNEESPERQYPAFGASRTRKVFFSENLILPSPIRSESSRSDEEDLEDGHSGANVSETTLGAAGPHDEERVAARAPYSGGADRIIGVNTGAGAEEQRPTELNKSAGVGRQEDHTEFSESVIQIRIFAGNLGSNVPTPKVLELTGDKTVRQVTREAVEHFLLYKEGGEDFYLAAQPPDGSEIPLNPEDRILDVNRALCAQYPEKLAGGSPGLYTPNHVKFYLSTRRGRIDQQKGRLIFRVCWHPQVDRSAPFSSGEHDMGLRSKPKRVSSFGFSKLPKKQASPPVASEEGPSSEPAQVISKLIAVGSDARASDVLRVTLEKFNIMASADPGTSDNYCLISVVPGVSERILDPEESVRHLLEVFPDGTLGNTISPRRPEGEPHPSLSPPSGTQFESEFHLVLARRPMTEPQPSSTGNSKFTGTTNGREVFHSDSEDASSKGLPIMTQGELKEALATGFSTVTFPDTQAVLQTNSSAGVLTGARVPAEPRRNELEQRSQSSTLPAGPADQASAADSNGILTSETLSSLNGNSTKQNGPSNTLTFAAVSKSGIAERRSSLAYMKIAKSEKRGSAIDIVLAKGLSREPSFTLRASLDDPGSGELRNSLNLVSKPRLSLVITNAEGIVENEMDVTDLIDAIVHGEAEGPTGPNEAPREVQPLGSFPASQHAPSEAYTLSRVLTNSSLEPVGGQQNASRQRVPDRRSSAMARKSIGEYKSTHIELPDLPSPIPAAAFDYSQIFPDYGDDSFGIGSQQQPPSPSSSEISVLASSPNEDSSVLESLENYLDILKADLSMEKLEKLERELKKVQQDATNATMPRRLAPEETPLAPQKVITGPPLSATAASPEPRQTGSPGAQKSGPAHYESSTAPAGFAAGLSARPPAPSPVRSPAPPGQPPSSLASKVPGTPQARVRSLMDGLGNLLILTRFGYPAERLEGAQVEAGHGRTGQNVEDWLRNQLQDFRHAERTLTAIEQGLDELMARVATSSWTTSA